MATMTGQREGDLLKLARSQLTDDGIVFSIGKSKRRHPRHGKVVETSKRVIVEWSPELRAVIDRQEARPADSPYIVVQSRRQAFYVRRLSIQLASPHDERADAWEEG
jgi:integrase